MDDVSVIAIRAHVSDSFPGTNTEGQHVDFEHLAPQRRTAFGEWGVVTQPCVVHQNVHPAITRPDFLEEAKDGRFASQIDLTGKAAPSLCLKLLFQFGDRPRVTTTRNHRTSISGEFADNGASDSGGSTGDQDNFILPLRLCFFH